MSKFYDVIGPSGHYDSPGMRRLRAHPEYDNIVKRTLAEQERAIRETVAARDAKAKQTPAVTGELKNVDEITGERTPAAPLSPWQKGHHIDTLGGVPYNARR